MTENNSESHETEKLENSWMIRDCEDYKDEYKECTKIRGRFHQYFIYGHFIDCNDWKKDYDKCCKWKKTKDPNVGNEIILSEKERRLARLRPHYMNDVWQRRTSPPEDWNKPLPEAMQKQYENSFLQIKADEMKNNSINDPKENRTLCVIS